MKSTRKPAIHYVLWTIQVLLALLFLFAGVVKLILPIETLTQQIQFPGLLLRFVAVAEICGAFGMILPGLFRIRPGLTPLAASGFVIIMIGATVVMATSMGVGQAVSPFVVGILAAFVSYGRLRLAPLPSRQN